MEYVELLMRIDDLSEPAAAAVPAEVASVPAALPKGHRIRTYRHEDAAAWARIEHEAAEFSTAEAAQTHFRSEFGAHEDEMAERCLFLLDPDSCPIGTATAWYNDDFHGESLGRLHWVAIIPQWQGRGLSKPLVARAMQVLSTHHRRAYLTTQTTSFVAVKVYLDLGFRPWITEEEQRKGWALMWEALHHPAIGGYA